MSVETFFREMKLGLTYIEINNFNIILEMGTLLEAAVGLGVKEKVILNNNLPSFPLNLLEKIQSPVGQIEVNKPLFL